MAAKKNIVLGITGSVAAYKACEVITCLRKNGFEVRCILSSNANRFLGVAQLEALSSNKAYTDTFEEMPEPKNPQHIALAECDALAVIPATANILGKVANGIADDLLSCVIMATKAPVIFAPAMNDNMYDNPIVCANIEKLKQHGYNFIGPVEGNLACGRVGMGHIAPVEEIVKKIKQLFSA